MRQSLLFLFCFLFLSGTRYLSAQNEPNTISGLQLWLDASDPNGNGTTPLNGTILNSWRDKSGFNRHTSISSSGSGFTSPAYYSNQINGKGVIRFTRTTRTVGAGYSSALDIRAITNPNITILTVYKQGTHQEDQAVWGCDDGGWDRFFFSSRAATPQTGSVSIGPGSPTTVDVAGAGQSGALQCLTAVYSKAGGTNGSAIYLNGNRIVGFTDNTTMGTDALSSIRIGLDGDDNYFNGDIAEMIVYNRVLTACEITQVNRYLNQKYGVSYSGVTISAGGTTTFQEGGSVTLSRTSPAGTSYQWLRNNTAISGANTSTYVATEPGDYTLAVTNGCIDTSAAITVTTTIPDAPNNAMAFNGNGGYIDLGSAITANSIRTLECWVKFNSLTGNQEILNKSSTNNGIELLLYNNRLAFFCMRTNANVSHVDYLTSNLVTGRWYHIVATWNGLDRTTMQLYVDGVSVGDRIDVGNLGTGGVSEPAVANGKVLVGDWNLFNRPLNGVVDEVRIWDRVRTQAEVRASAYDTLARNTPGLLAYLRMDQGIAAGNNVGITTVKDYSSYNRTATLTNITRTGSGSNFVESYALVAPMPVAASGVNSTGFTANWTAPVVGTVNNYLLDVSTSPDFSSFVAGYQARNVGNVTSFAVSGLTNGTTYYYRLRANKTNLANEGAYSYASVSVIPASTLPARWDYFRLQAQANGNLLKWGTLQESNTDYFTIERSTDGQRYTAIGTIKAAGESAEKKAYSFHDATTNPYEKLYYRIQLTDRDGTVSYSAVRTLQGPTASTVKIFPVPAKEYVYIRFPVFEGSTTDNKIFDVTGRQVIQFNINSNPQKVDISSLPAGYYFIVLKDGSYHKFEKK